MTTGAMTPTEREAFLEGVHIGILAIDEPGRGPLAMPIWYLVRDGAVHITTGGYEFLLKDTGLQLWTFQVNEAARRFYERQGFVAAESTDGSGNEERSPDVRYTWSA